MGRVYRILKNDASLALVLDIEPEAQQEVMRLRSNDFYNETVISEQAIMPFLLNPRDGEAFADTHEVELNVSTLEADELPVALQQRMVASLWRPSEPRRSLSRSFVDTSRRIVDRRGSNKVL